MSFSREKQSLPQRRIRRSGGVIDLKRTRLSWICSQWIITVAAAISLCASLATANCSDGFRPASALKEWEQQMNEAFMSGVSDRVSATASQLVAETASSLRKPSLPPAGTQTALGRVEIQNGSVILFGPNTATKVLYQNKPNGASTDASSGVLQSPTLGPASRMIVSPDGKSVLIGFVGPGIENRWILSDLNGGLAFTASPLQAPHSSISFGADGKSVYFLEFKRSPRDPSKRMQKGSLQSTIVRAQVVRGREYRRLVFSRPGQNDNMKAWDVNPTKPGSLLVVANESGLGFSFGAKTFESIFIGRKGKDGTYQWLPLEGRNRFVSQLLRARVDQNEGKLYLTMQSDRINDSFSIVEIEVPLAEQSSSTRERAIPLRQQKVRTLIATRFGQKLYHSKDLGEGVFSAVYHDRTVSPKALDSTLVIQDADRGQVLLRATMQDLGFRSAKGLIFAPELAADGNFYLRYASVVDGGTHLIRLIKQSTLSASSGFKLEAIDLPKPFEIRVGQTIQQKVVFNSFGADEFPTLVYFAVDTATGKATDSSFLFIRTYGKLGLDILDQAEAPQIIGLLKAGGAVAIPGVPGTTELGSTWFKTGVRRPVQQTLSALSIAIDLLLTGPATKQMLGLQNVDRGQTFLMGRSWGGTQVLAFANRFPSKVNAVFSIVPVLDIRENHLHNPTGVLTIGDHAPEVDRRDPTGDQLINADFWRSLQSTDPVKLIESLSETDTRIVKVVGTSDFVIDQRAISERLDRQLSVSIGRRGLFGSIYNEGAGHGDRRYELQLLIEILRTLESQNSK